MFPYILHDDHPHEYSTRLDNFDLEIAHLVREMSDISQGETGDDAREQQVILQDKLVVSTRLHAPPTTHPSTHPPYNFYLSVTAFPYFNFHAHILTRIRMSSAPNWMIR